MIVKKENEDKDQSRDTLTLLEEITKKYVLWNFRIDKDFFNWRGKAWVMGENW